MLCSGIIDRDQWRKLRVHVKFAFDDTRQTGATQALLRLIAKNPSHGLELVVHREAEIRANIGLFEAKA
jgi:hypothetical protein